MSLEAGLYTFVESREDFLDVISHLQKFDLLGVDFEGEWNLHRYGLHLCLIQVSDGEKTFIIDPLTVGDLAPFLDILEDPAVEIISHGPQSDLVLMDYLFGRHPTNVFDTEKAGQLLGYESTSLSYLLEMHFGISKNMKVRVSDWNIRPLTDKMLNYAAKDVEYLHRLRTILTQELKEIGRYEWLQEECTELEDIRYKKKETPHLDIRYASKLNANQAHVLKYLYEMRDSIAQKVDKPAYYIIPNSKLIDLATNAPKTEAEWLEIKGVNPRIKKYAKDFFLAVQEAKTTVPDKKAGLHDDRDFNGLSKNAYFKLVDERTAILEQIREQIKEDYNIYPMILSMRNLKRVAYGEATLNDFKKWQKDILFAKAKEMELDLTILLS